MKNVVYLGTSMNLSRLLRSTQLSRKTQVKVYNEFVISVLISSSGFFWAIKDKTIHLVFERNVLRIIFGAFLEFNDERYQLFDLPNVAERSRTMRGSCGEGRCICSKSMLLATDKNA